MPELATKADVHELRASIQELRADIREFRCELRAGFNELRAGLELRELRLTIRLGIMWALAMWAVVMIVKHT